MADTPPTWAGRQVTDLTTLTGVADGDWVPIYDVSAPGLRKISASQIVAAVKYTTIAAMKNATGHDENTITFLSDGTERSGWFQLRDGAPSEAAGDYQGVELTYAGDAGLHWHRIYNGMINAKWFGAVGDNVTDDTAAIQAALDTVEVDNWPDAGNGGIFLPEGKYVVNGLILKEGVYIHGEGQGSSLFMCKWVPDSITSITSSGTTATITFSAAHGKAAGDRVLVTGCDQNDYNGLWTIATVPTSATLTYTMAGTPAASPATGSSIQVTKDWWAVGAIGTYDGSEEPNVWGVYNCGFLNWAGVETPNAHSDRTSAVCMLRVGQGTEFHLNNCRFLSSHSHAGSPFGSMNHRAISVRWEDCYGGTISQCVFDRGNIQIYGAAFESTHGFGYGRIIGNHFFSASNFAIKLEDGWNNVISNNVFRADGAASKTTYDVVQLELAVSSSVVSSNEFVYQFNEAVRVTGSRNLITGNVLHGGDPWADLPEISTLNESGGTATLTFASAHGVSDGDVIVITGADSGDSNPEAYNGVHRLNVTGDTTGTIKVASGTGNCADATLLTAQINKNTAFGRDDWDDYGFVISGSYNQFDGNRGYGIREFYKFDESASPAENMCRGHFLEGSGILVTGEPDESNYIEQVNGDVVPAKCWNFQDSDGDYITSTIASAIGVGDPFSIFLRVKTVGDANHGLVYIGDSASPASSANPNIHIYLSSTGVLNCWITSNGTTYWAGIRQFSLLDSEAWQHNVWHDFLLIRTGASDNRLKLYFDGNEVDLVEHRVNNSAAVPYSSAITGQYFSVGRTASTSRDLDGYVSHAAYFASALDYADYLQLRKDFNYAVDLGADLAFGAENERRGYWIRNIGTGADATINNGRTPGTVVAHSDGVGLFGSATYDAPSIAASGTTTTTVTVTGAALGDQARVTFGVDLGGLVMTAYVSAVDTVTVVLFNPTAGAIDLDSTTVTAEVFTI